MNLSFREQMDFGAILRQQYIDWINQKQEKQMSKTTKRFENFMTMYLSKPPSDSSTWICGVLADDKLTYEAIGILIILGEKLRGSAFGIQTVLDLKLNPDPRQTIDTLFFLESLGYIRTEIHKPHTAKDLQDYFETFYK